MTLLSRAQPPPCVGCSPGPLPHEGRLRTATAVSAGASLAALVSHVLGLLDMRFFLIFLGAPSAVLVLAEAVYARLLDGEVFLHNLALGLKAVAMATVVYDVVRIGAMQSHLFSYDAFYAIRIFGSWIAREPVGSGAAQLVGWAYHAWNGLSFGAMFTLTFGRARSWRYGLAYGLVMEVIMLGLFPLFLHVSDRVGFVTVSLLGHAAFGTTLGVLAARRGRPWRGAASA